MADTSHEKSHDVDGRSPITCELSDAAARFLKLSADDSTLRLLLLIDPIRAFSETGIELSRGSRRLLRRLHPEAAYGNDSLYDGVRSGSTKLEWIQDVELGSVVHAKDAPEADPEICKELGL